MSERVEEEIKVYAGRKSEREWDQEHTKEVRRRETERGQGLNGNRLDGCTWMEWA